MVRTEIWGDVSGGWGYFASIQSDFKSGCLKLKKCYFCISRCLLKLWRLSTLYFIFNSVQTLKDNAFLLSRWQFDLWYTLDGYQTWHDCKCLREETFPPKKGGKGSDVIQLCHTKHSLGEKSQNFPFGLTVHVSSSATAWSNTRLGMEVYDNMWSCTLEVVISESFLDLNQVG